MIISAPVTCSSRRRQSKPKGPDPAAHPQRRSAEGGNGLAAHPRERRRPALVQSIVEIANVLHLDVVAEGVETKVQADFLRDLDCAYAQGFFFSRPLDGAQLEAMLRAEVLAPAV
jgi:hypothetical protein